MAIKKYMVKWSMVLAGAVLFCLMLFASMGSYVTQAEETNQLTSVYHVYAADEYIGTVDSKTMVQQRLADQLNTAKEDIKQGVKLTWNKPISFVEERISAPEFTNQKVMDYITSDVSIKAEAVELRVGDKSVGYFKNKETAQQVIQDYQRQYVDDEVLKTINKLKDNAENDGKSTDPLSNNKDFNRLETDEQTLSPKDQRVTNVWLSNKVSYTDKQAAFDELTSAKQGLKTLQTGTLEDHTHYVEKGDVLESIADTYDLTADKILELNSDLTADSTLQIDQAIHVKQYEPFTQVMVSAEQVKKETMKHDTKYKKTDDLPKGETEIKQTGKDGKKKVRYKITKADGDKINKQVIKEKVLQEPVKKIVLKGTKVIPSRGTKSLIWPTNGGHVSSAMGHRWGRMHKGIDIAGPGNRSIKAADNGVVTKAGYSGTYGNRIEINHNNGMKTIYAHLSSIKASAGQTVQKGQTIGVMGSTGRSTGVHLHFEVYENGSLENPSNYF